MPRLSFDTNVPASKISDEFLNECSRIISKSLNKPHSYCVSTVNPGVKMTIGGSGEPCGYIEITSIGGLEPELNKKHAAVITDYIHRATGIPKNKLFTNFQSNSTTTVGYLGTTFHQLYVVEKGLRLR